MKLLIYGGHGWIGNQFQSILKNNATEYTLGKCRVNNINDLKEEINNIKPTHIVSFIGRTHGKIDDKEYTTIDYLEQTGKLKENIRDNLYSPLLLAIVSKELNIHYTYLGTGCIFNYDEEHPYSKEENGFSEESQPNFFGSSYSICKGFTDEIMKLYEENTLNLRIRMPITNEENPRNFITKIVNYEKICSISNSMTVLPELLPKVLDMMKNNITGTINLTNPGLISHNEILDMYKEIVDPSFTYKNFTLEEQREILASERSNNYLNTDKLEKLYPDIKNIKESVREVLEVYKIKEKIDDEYIFVTGGAGFIASNFINYYCNKYPDRKLINFDALYYCADVNNVNETIRNSDNYKFIKGNLQNIETIKLVFSEYNIVKVIHFAAQSHVDGSFSTPLQYTKDNILGTHNLLEVARTKCKDLKLFIHISTDEVYGESELGEEEAKNEMSILCPTNPYAATKAGAELMAQSYIHSYKMPIIITRGNNVYGKNQYPEKLIPKFIKLLKEDKPLTIHGDGSSLRSFIHVDDVVKAFDIILEKGKIGEIYNIGTKIEYSVMKIAYMLIKIIKDESIYQDKFVTFVKDREFNDKRYFINYDKLKELGWKPTIGIEEGIIKTIDWFEK